MTLTIASPHDPEHLETLNGWRGISILLVLAAHLLPLGSSKWQLNSMAGPMGMALFFTLSGFLITSNLLSKPYALEFLTRRFFRIIPLAWIGILAAFAIDDAPGPMLLPNLLFYANLPPTNLTESGSHFWSLCVEMQFYVSIALLVATLGLRGLYLLPVFCMAVTLNRILHGAQVDIVTWLRVDEILAGATLALAYAGKLGNGPAQLLSRCNTVALFALLALASHPSTGALNYLRPYIAAILVGTTLVAPSGKIGGVLKGRILGYFATTSYAIYVIHHLLMFTWLGSGDKLVKYLKRPALFAATFALAHLSTYYFESRCIKYGKNLAEKLARSRIP